MPSTEARTATLIALWPQQSVVAAFRNRHGIHRSLAVLRPRVRRQRVESFVPTAKHTSVTTPAQSMTRQPAKPSPSAFRLEGHVGRRGRPGSGAAEALQHAGGGEPIPCHRALGQDRPEAAGDRVVLQVTAGDGEAHGAATDRAADMDRSGTFVDGGKDDGDGTIAPDSARTVRVAPGYSDPSSTQSMAPWTGDRNTGAPSSAG